jgi:prepilin-type N-terminal cleavage/methylation domain-containing protein
MKPRTSRLSRAQRGFTLAEILVTTAIFAVIMIAALAVYDKSNRVFKASTENADMQQSTRIGFDKLVSDLRMAGFDYSRGGTPSGTNQYAQPDEQLEFVGQNALAFRANFDYYSDTANKNGLEPTYTPASGEFPYVSTGNDEIVVYALKSSDSTKNTSTISFWVDSDKPRSAFPPAGKEKQIKITGIDTTNDNPPYTLVRMTVDDASAGGVIDATNATPVAENLRSLQFYYYTDAGGTTPLKDAADANIDNGHNADGSTFTAKDKAGAYTGAIGGDGQWDATKVGTTTNFADRSQRSIISSVRVTVVGMNSAPEPGYTHPTETVASIKNYKQYSLTSLIVPRNLGLTGFPEPSYTPPGSPTITGICTGHCAAPVITWSAPTTGGPVLEYKILSDTNQNGAYTNTFVIPDSAATSAVMPDDGTDPSVIHYYKVLAVNDNGSSPSDVTPTSATPKNSTKPKAPSGLAATNNQPNAINLTWVAPTDNASGKATLSCTGTASASGSSIPAQEIIRYRVWRGTTANFDPTQSGQGVMVLDTTDQSQPSGVTPGASVTWVDTGAIPAGMTSPSSRSTPAACVQYYYRVQALDRCSASNGQNTSNDKNDSISDYYPALGSAGIAGIATSSATPNTPTSLQVDTNNSACPSAVGGSTCKISLSWNKVTADSAGNAVGIDVYRITRQRKHVTDASWSTDPTMSPTDVSGYSQSSGGTATWIDNTAAVSDSTGIVWYYRYTVAAKLCSTYSSESAPAFYPTLCSINPLIVQANASNPSADGTTPQTAWIFNSGDTVTVSPPVGATFTITKVTFDVTGYPSGASVDSVTDTTSPFVYTWSDRTDGQIYQVTMTVTNSLNCVEQQIRYVQDQQGAPCAFPAVTSPLPSPSVGGNNSGTVTSSINFTVPNNGTDPLQLASKSIKITWADPDGQHPDMKLSAIVWATGAFSTTDNLTTPDASGSVTRTIPANMPNVAGKVGAVVTNFTVTIRFTWTANVSGHGSNAVTDNPLNASPLKKICIDYAVASESGVTKHCNLVGQAATTANPTNCD